LASVSDRSMEEGLKFISGEAVTKEVTVRLSQLGARISDSSEQRVTMQKAKP
jgi:hypothetical protein